MTRFVDLFGTGVRDLFGTLLVGGAMASLRRASARVTGVEEVVALAFGFRYCGIRIAPGQVPSEITQLLHVLAKNPPGRVLEIGTAGGGNFFLLARVAAERALLISADLPAGPFGGGYPQWRGRLIRSFARPTQQLHLLAADSHSAETLRKVWELLSGEALDFLFIDGDHRYEGVKADFRMYAPLVRNGGLIGFHDIVPGPAEKVGGVARFWEEMKQQYAVQEFVADWNQGGYGIGLVVKTPAMENRPAK
jgi:predicted O-methyltransferase YrrM